jgi:hypothetical protein
VELRTDRSIVGSLPPAYIGDGVQWALDTPSKWEVSAGDRKSWIYMIKGALESSVVV